VEDEEDVFDDEEIGEVEVMSENITSHISMNTLDETIGFNTLKVTGKVSKHSLYIMVNSSSTHYFIKDQVAHILQYELTTIKLLTVEATNGGTMICSSLCKNQWRMKGVNFMADVFIMELNNYDMVLEI